MDNEPTRTHIQRRILGHLSNNHLPTLKNQRQRKLKNIPRPKSQHTDSDHCRIETVNHKGWLSDLWDCRVCSTSRSCNCIGNLSHRTDFRHRPLHLSPPLHSNRSSFHSQARYKPFRLDNPVVEDRSLCRRHKSLWNFVVRSGSTSSFLGSL